MDGRKGELFFCKGMVGKGMGGAGFGIGDDVGVLNRAVNRDGVMEVLNSWNGHPVGG